MAMDDGRVWIAYGGEKSCFWRAVHNAFPLKAVQSKWRLGSGNVYVKDTLVNYGISLSDLFSLGCGSGTLDDPLIIRTEIASDAREPLFYCEAGAGQIAAFNLTENGQVQIWQIAQHFGLWPWTAWIRGAGREGKLQIDQVQRSSGRTGSSNDPFQIGGYYGPFSHGSVGSLSGPSGSGLLDLQILEPLHMSFSVAVYSTVITSTGEQAVLKLDYDPSKSLTMKIGLECATLADLRDKGIMSPSLPVLVRRGSYHPNGSLQCEFGDVSGIVTKPLGKRCLQGMVFHGNKLCKVAFDVLLGIYHLSLVGRKHRDVRVQNLVLVGEDQCMLIDLEFTYSVDVEHLFSDVKEAAASDCRQLLFCLLELSGHRLATRFDDETDIAIDLLGRESEVLGEFGKYIFGLAPQVWPDFRLWLDTLGTQGCNLPEEYLRNAVAGRVSLEIFSSPPLLVCQGFPLEAVWVTYQGQTRFFLPAAHGLFPLAKVKHVWNLCEVSIGGVLLVDGQDRVSDLCGRGDHGKGTRQDPLQITGRPRAARLIRCQETVPEIDAVMKTLPPNQDFGCFAGLSQALACASSVKEKLELDVEVSLQSSPL